MYADCFTFQINNLFGTGSEGVEHKIEHDEKKGTTSVTGVIPGRISHPWKQ